ncbi:MAG: phytoene/squalene synthase family protein [Candidatus Eremiobacteraeota bacterium]|nr:phytoene/squalene synthase family protein [Candidatus Eremiobacteraeota bacterium]
MLDLPQSRRWCSQTMRAHAKSFYFSTRLLPKDKREAIEALYGLFRFADDAADEPGPTPFQRRDVFTSIHRDLDGIKEPSHCTDAPWFAALKDAIRRYPIDVSDVRRLVEGCESDLVPRTIETLADLETYSQAVAGTVGRTSLPVLGASDTDSLARGERLGVAMQYTNVLRDIEDDRRMGRNYLPRAAFPGESTPTIMFEIARVARTYYAESAVLATRLPNDGSRAALLMTSAIYEGILDRLARTGYDPLAGRVYVPLASKVTIALRSLVHAYAGF